MLYYKGNGRKAIRYLDQKVEEQNEGQTPPTTKIATGAE